MRILDTVVLVSSNDPTHHLYSRASSHLLSIRIGNDDVYLPSIVLTEYDLELKIHGFSQRERENMFRILGTIIPNDKMLPCTPSIHENAIQLEVAGGWFDSLIASTAIEYSATIVSTDQVFDQLNISRIW